MDQNSISATVDRALLTYIMMGKSSDDARRQMLLVTAADYIRANLEKGETDPERLEMLALKHLVSLEQRPPLRIRR